jgi:polysaccharide biosynthesis protein PslH
LKILFITQVVPIPPSGGERIRSYGLLSCLVQLGYQVLAITPPLENIADAELQLPGVTFIPFNFDTPSGSVAQFGSYFKPDKRLKALILQMLSREHIELAFIDYFFLGQYVPVIKAHGIPVIYGTHNAQSQLRLQQPAKGIAAKLTRFFSFLAQSIHERVYFRKADELICVSEIDFQFYRKFIPEKKISVIPNFVDEALYRPSDVKKPSIIMTGNFSSFQNYQGLEWFINNVWNEELEEITSLYLVGKGAEKAFTDASGSRVHRKVVIRENPADFQEMIASALVAVVPLWHGSGTRLKCIEAMALKTQLISTTIGAEGINHQGSILIADSPEQFRQSIKLAVLKKSDHTLLAYHVFIENYSLKANIRPINDIIHSVISMSNK